ncbi:glycosyltransferase [Streptomyces natalensis]|uniref:Uncharacterized protein n=1 Tax=Streptomyces natalensis ATCC 27448 TaxID=1240678 RepID=A0A0D7CJ01_9ACTN|nr:glycosyltransferase [Streptomyces natalensis]KIZ16199.1 hypothetical protein SNA_23660 [Streptomyces natalensis ATCC 27448]
MTFTLTFLALGTRGDAQPYTAVGRVLRERGHRVRIATEQRYRGLVEEAGLEHLPIDVDAFNALALGPDGRRLLESGRNPLRLARRARPLAAAYADQVVRSLADSCTDADAVVCSAVGMAFRPAVVPPSVPFCYGGLQPTYPTRAFPTIHLAGHRSLGGWANKRSHSAVETLLWHVFRRFLASRSARSLPLRSPTAQLRRAGHPKLYGFSRAVVPRPADWPRSVHVTGYWFTDHHAAWTPPPDLGAFLAGGPPPVCVGFSSIVPGGREQRLIRTALRRAGTRGVLLGDPAAMPSDDEFHVLAEAPHQWLFPRMAAVVHHGGAGTTAAGLRAGVPQVVTPFYADQPFWGERLHALGVGTAPLPVHTLTADQLTGAVRQALADRAMGERAKALQEQIAAERGPERAADLLEEWLAHTRR